MTSSGNQFCTNDFSYNFFFVQIISLHEGDAVGFLNRKSILRFSAVYASSVLKSASNAYGEILKVYSKDRESKQTVD